MQQQKPLPPTSIFCAAAPCDATLQAQWEKHLLPLEQAGYITVWSEQRLLAGSPRIEQMHDHLAQQCDPDEKSRVRGQVLIAQEHQPLPSEQCLHVSAHTCSPRATTRFV